MLSFHPANTPPDPAWFYISTTASCKTQNAPAANMAPLFQQHFSPLPDNNKEYRCCIHRWLLLTAENILSETGISTEWWRWWQGNMRNTIAVGSSSPYNIP